MVTLEEIGRITEEPNAVLRNLRITQCYHDLSVELAGVIDRGNANWSTFATWASRDRRHLDPRRGAPAGGRYAAAAGESDAATRAELILLANCQIGLHEQTRLQDDIQDAMNAPVAAFVTDGLGRLLLVRLAFVLLGPIGIRRELVRAAIQGEWQRVATRFSLRLSLPGGRVLPLGGDWIPWPSQIPEPLRTLRHPELIAFLQRFDEDTERLRTRGAENWSRLSDRMGFICELFRAEQQNGSLFDQPFSDAARAEIGRGIVPGEGV